MTPFRIRARLIAWASRKFLGVDVDALESVQPDPPPVPPVDRVDVVPPDAPFLGNDAAAFLAPTTKSPVAPVLDLPLKGSVEERLRRFKL